MGVSLLGPLWAARAGRWTLGSVCFGNVTLGVLLSLQTAVLSSTKAVEKVWPPVQRSR